MYEFKDNITLYYKIHIACSNTLNGVNITFSMHITTNML